jgi:hypothetical protein
MVEKAEGLWRHEPLSGARVPRCRREIHMHHVPRMSVHIYIEKINRAKRILFTLHESGTVRVLCTILVLSSAHECVRTSISVTTAFHSADVSSKGNSDWSAVKQRTLGESFLDSCVRFEVFTVLTMKNGIFWDVTPCGSCKNWHFGGT